jgi:hypothetical protein
MRDEIIVISVSIVVAMAVFVTKSLEPLWLLLALLMFML